MAEGAASGDYSGRRQYDLYLYVRTDGQSGNSTKFAWELRARSKSGYGSFTSDAWTWQVLVAGHYFEGRSALPFAPGDYAGKYIVLGSGTTGWVGHDSNGNLNIQFNANHNTGSVFGSASTNAPWIAIERIPKRPASPNTPQVSQVTTTTARFDWNLPDNNGAGLDQMLLRISQNPNIEAGPYSDYPQSGGTTGMYVGGLLPGNTYYACVYAHNSQGYSDRSGTAGFTMLPATPPGLTITPSLSGTSAVISMSPPGNVSGVSKYVIERRRLLSPNAVTVIESGSTTLTVSSLTPGVSYEWRASAYIGSYQSPWTEWTARVQPNPNTTPGEYFDGSTAARSDVTYSWAGAANNSVSRALSSMALGWVSFAQGASVSGGGGAVHRGTGGSSGPHMARVVFFNDCTAAGFRLGTAPIVGAASDVDPGAVYWGSIVTSPSRSQRLAAQVSWYKAGADAITPGALISRTTGEAQVVPANSPQRLSVRVQAPAEAQWATIESVDVAGSGHSLWRGGEALWADAAMITLSNLYPYFDGSFAQSDNDQAYDYAWLGVPHASPSIRLDVDPADVPDPLQDPDCAAVPAPPRPPVILDDCIEEVTEWRRYLSVIPAGDVSEWQSTLPTLEVKTGAQAERQMRIRYHPNPFGYPSTLLDLESFCAEQIVSYIPPNTTLTIDGELERVFAEVNGAGAMSADHLLYGTGGSPATWPDLSCGISYLVSVDVPPASLAGNVSTSISLTRRA